MRTLEPLPSEISAFNAISRLSISNNANCLDLFCGTGYVTDKLANLTKIKVTGVDASPDMIEVAKKNHGDKCHFINDDALEFLKKQPPNCYDIVTCAWAICYSKPYQVIKEISRVLKPGGYVGIIDNKLHAIWEMFLAAIFTVAEKPKMLRHVMKMHILLNKKSLTLRMKFSGLNVLDSWDGEKVHYVSTGIDAVKRMLSTGVFAGCEFFVYKKYRNYVLERFPKIVEERYMQKKGIPIIHRTIAAIGKKS